MVALGTEFQAKKVLAGLKHEKRCKLAATDIQKHYRGWQVSNETITRPSL